MKIARALGASVTLLFLGWFFLLGGRQHIVSEQLNASQVADNEVAQYEIAKRHGDKIQICTQASLVAQVYLQAQDEEKYAAWKDTERADCSAAGVPVP